MASNLVKTCGFLTLIMRYFNEYKKLLDLVHSWDVNSSILRSVSSVSPEKGHHPSLLLTLICRLHNEMCN